MRAERSAAADLGVVCAEARAPLRAWMPGSKVRRKVRREAMTGGRRAWQTEPGA